jgi:hypothetical protein
VTSDLGFVCTSCAYNKDLLLPAVPLINVNRGESIDRSIGQMAENAAEEAKRDRSAFTVGQTGEWAVGIVAEMAEMPECIPGCQCTRCRCPRLYNTHRVR